MVKTLILSSLAARAAKKLVPAKRPDGPERDSFPSSHTMNTMAVAVQCSRCAPKATPLWYGGTLLLALSRLLLRRHRLRDVVGGSLLGYGVAKAIHSTSKRARRSVGTRSGSGHDQSPPASSGSS